MFLFLKKSFIFLVSALAFGCAYFIINFYESDIKNIYGYEVHHSIQKSLQKKDNIKILILGDSVGKQVYDNQTYNGRIYSLACNQAISLAGQFILLNNFLSLNDDNHDLEVILVSRPSSFNNNLDQKFTFQYFLKPFFTETNKLLMSKFSISQVQKIPFFQWSQHKLIKESNWSPNFPHPPIRFDISQVSVEYIKKMDSLCKEKGVKSFKLYCSPLSSSVNREDINYFKERIYDLGLSNEFAGYFENILFIDKDDFMQDQIHLLTDKIPENFLKLDLNQK